jgi:hypothetical protein
VISRINEGFVATWILVDDAKRLGLQGDAFAKTLEKNWEFPLDLMFFNSDGKFVNKLNSFKDLRSAHTDVGHPPDGRGQDAGHAKVFLGHVKTHFPLGASN